MKKFCLIVLALASLALGGCHVHHYHTVQARPSPTTSGTIYLDHEVETGRTRAGVNVTFKL